MTLVDAINELAHENSVVRFARLILICETFFGHPRIRGSHHIFKMKWAGDPRINLQRCGKDAKPYQIKQIVAALKKLQELDNK